MSVQAGIWNFDGRPASQALLARIGGAMVRYGPDREASHFAGPLGMLFRALYTTSEARLERQPQVFAGENVITWDGRLDNREALIEELEGDLATGCTDLSIVISAFTRWKTKCFAKFVGEWALAIWNPFEQVLILARDYVGVRRLYFFLDSRRVTWCTQLAPLALSCGTLTLSDEYAAAYLTLHLSGHGTPYCEIEGVPPGGFVCIRPGRASIHHYWSFDPQSKTRYKTDSEYEEHFRLLFQQAVRRRLRSHTPILAELSGGLDSSSIVCMADDLLSSQRNVATSLDTFSYSYPDEPEGDDHLYFTAVEERRGKTGRHAELRGVGDSFSLDYSDFPAVPVLGVRREVEAARSEALTKNGYRVTLSGFGGDEIVGQALEARVVMADLLRRFRLGAFTDQLFAWSLLFRIPSIHLLAETMSLLLPSSVRSRLAASTLEPWINAQFARKYNLAGRSLSAAIGSLSWLPGTRDSFQTYGALAGVLTNLPPTEDETRYPFLDQTLVEFMMSVPTDQLLRPGERRSLMRRSLRHILPAKVLSRRTKQIEGRCYIVTLQKHWSKLTSVISSPISANLGYTLTAEFQRALKMLRDGRMSDSSMLILRGLFLELWLQTAIKYKVIAMPADSNQSAPNPFSTRNQTSLMPSIFC